MKLELDSFFETVIAMKNIDSFTSKEIAVGFCCLTKNECYELTNIEKKVIELTRKFTKDGLLTEMRSEGSQYTTFKKTDLFYEIHKCSNTVPQLKANYLRDLQAQRYRCSFEVLEYESQREKYYELYEYHHNLKEIMEPASKNLEERYNGLLHKLKVMDQLIEIYKIELNTEKALA
jgi:Asp-tRNA(Asn)/Glu-tRNA(Gln) amidotransferase B subunit